MRASHDTEVEAVRNYWMQFTSSSEGNNPLREIADISQVIRPGPRHALSIRCRQFSLGEGSSELTDDDIREILRTPDEREKVFSPEDFLHVRLNDWKLNEEGAGFMIPAPLHGDAHRVFIWSRHRVPPELPGSGSTTGADTYVNHKEVADAMCPGDDAATEAIGKFAFEIAPNGSVTFFQAEQFLAKDEYDALSTLVCRIDLDLGDPDQGWKFG